MVTVGMLLFRENFDGEGVEYKNNLFTHVFLKVHHLRCATAVRNNAIIRQSATPAVKFYC